eukprot:6207872-Prymnesium_polylepis.1
MAMPILQALDDEGTDLAVGKGGVPLLDTLAAALDEQLATHCNALRPLGRHSRRLEGLGRLRLVPEAERVLVVTLLHTRIVQPIGTTARHGVNAVAPVDAHTLLALVVIWGRRLVEMPPGVDDRKVLLGAIKVAARLEQHPSFARVLELLSHGVGLLDGA